MTSRQRGAAYLLAALVAGRLLDVLDLPFERRSPQGPSDSTQTAAGAPTPRLAAADSTAGRPVVVGAAAAAAGGAALAAQAVPDAAPDAARGGAPPDSGRGRQPPAPVAVNRAGAAELQRLPGVGPVLAQRIVAYREAHGALRSLADLRRVKGIGPRTCERLAPHVRFD